MRGEARKEASGMNGQTSHERTQAAPMRVGRVSATYSRATSSPWSVIDPTAGTWLVSASVGADGEAWEAKVLVARQADAEQYVTEWTARVVEYDGLVGVDGPVAHGRTRHDAVCMALTLYVDASPPSAP